MNSLDPQKRLAYYGGTFDPLHCGHLNIAKTLVSLFHLDAFVFIPAFHAPHKPDSKPTSAYHRYAMLCLATENEPKLTVSLMEIETGERRFSLDTLTQLSEEIDGNVIFFVMGADSWRDITTWHEWKTVLTMTNHIVVSRPGVPIGTDHVTDQIKERIVDLRGRSHTEIETLLSSSLQNVEKIYFTDAVNFDISATTIREDVRNDDVLDRAEDVPPEVAKYIEKYELYR